MMKNTCLLILLVLVFPLKTNARTNENMENVKSVEGYFETISAYDQNDNLVTSMTVELSKEEYENEDFNRTEYSAMRTFGNVCNNGIATCTYETEYKKLNLTVDGRKIVVNNTWKEMPKIKHLDTIGFVIASASEPIVYNPQTFSVEQIYDGNVITYDGKSGNRIKSKYGDALVTNIVNSVSNSLSVEMTIGVLNIPYKAVINASYQHGTTTTLTAEEAKSFVLGSSTNDPNKICLGGTFIYPRSIGANKYDQTQGVQLVMDF